MQPHFQIKRNIRLYVQTLVKRAFEFSQNISSCKQISFVFTINFKAEFMQYAAKEFKQFEICYFLFVACWCCKRGKQRNLNEHMHH